MNKKELKREIVNGVSAYDCVVSELKVLKKLQHPNIIWLHSIIDDDNKDNMYLVTEYYSKGSIEDLVESKQKKLSKFFEDKNQNVRRGLQPAKVRLYFIDMLRALYYCHNYANVIHRDIKPANFVLNHNDEAILIDFGVSCQF